MFRKRKQEPQARQAAKPAVKLTAAEKREIRRILETARGDGKPIRRRIPYPSGRCTRTACAGWTITTWSRCMEFEDVNYQLAKPDDQTAIFEALCDMYNAHDASIGMELSLVCREVNKADFRKTDRDRRAGGSLRRYVPFTRICSGGSLNTATTVWSRQSSWC